MQFFQPNILINLTFRDFIFVWGKETSLLLFFLENFVQNFLFNFWHSIDLFDHFVKNIHDCSNEIIDTSCIVETWVIKSSHKISFKQRNMLDIVLGPRMNHGSIIEVVSNFVNRNNFNLFRNESSDELIKFSKGVVCCLPDCVLHHVLHNFEVFS